MTRDDDALVPDASDLAEERPLVEDDTPPARRPMRRAWGRGAAGLAASAVAVAAVLAGAALPWPAIGGETPAIEVTPAPSETVLACEGPVLALGRDATAASAIGVAAPSALTAATGSGSVPEPQPLAHPDVDDDDAPLRFVQPPIDRVGEPIAAAASAELDDEDLAGFAASACRPGSMESWIVGGDTAVGETDLLILSNPGQVNATVQLTVYGATEPVVPPGGEALPIPAGTQRVLPLAGLAGGEATPVIRVTASGAPVRAALQSSLVRTLDPAGIDRQGAVSAASRQVFPGVAVTSEAASAEGAPGIVRLLARETGEATITAIAEGETDPAVDPVTVPLEAERPLSVDLGDLPAGYYTVTVDASTPIVGAVWQTTGFGRDVDFAWQTPSPEITGPTLVAVPDGPSPALRVANGAGSDATVTVTDASGAERQLEVPAGSSAALALEAGESYSVDPGGAAVSAAVSYLGEVAIASIPLWPDPAAPTPVTVRP